MAEALPVAAQRLSVLRRPPGRGLVAASVLAAWCLLWTVLRGHATLALPTAEPTALHLRIAQWRDWIDAHRASNGFFTGFIDVVRSGIDATTVFVQSLISQPGYGRPVPLIGWLGVVALATFGAYLVARPRTAVLCAAGLASLGLLGLWRESMGTLALTIVAVVLSLLIGIPGGVALGLSRRLERIVTPVLDVMQAMPTFVYLAPLTLFFLIGPAAAVIATLIYAAPPVIRLTAHGIRTVNSTVLEASTSLGASRWQLLRTVRIPLARRTIVVGINQTTMAALSMVTIAALIDAPGLGDTVLKALSALDVGRAFTGGLAIVIMAIILDRVTTGASVRRERDFRGVRRSVLARRLTLATLAGGTAICLYLAYTFYWAALFPGPTRGGVVGASIEDGVNAATDWSRLHLFDATEAVKNVVTYGLLNPFQALLADSPWYLAAAAILALSAVVSGRAGLRVAAVCLALLLGTGLWSAAMQTLAATVVATVIVVALAVVAGVGMARNRRADALVRPILDAAQVMPAFVYLVPFVGLFGPTRLTAIVAAVVFAAPVAIKIVADGVRGVPPTVVEAAVASGSSPWQVVTKVQLPLARDSVFLAANQGLIYVLSMVVVGGLVGAGALGYLVVAGFSQSDLYGKGLAAGLAIVLLGILLDRVAQHRSRTAVDGRGDV
jgi:glycine betaine/proline transport system permease protein